MTGDPLILVLNTGSSSLKFSLFHVRQTGGGRFDLQWAGHVEKNKNRAEFCATDAAEIRARIVQSCAWLGVRLDAGANRAGAPRISTAASRVSAWVIPTNEELMIARHTWKLYSTSRQKN